MVYGAGMFHPALAYIVGGVLSMVMAVNLARRK